MKDRPEIFRLISGRYFFSTTAKYKNEPFDNESYTQMVLDKIAQGSNLDYNENGLTLLYLAVQDYEYEFTLALLEMGLDVNASTAQGATPLHVAVSRYKKDRNSEKLIKLLLDHGASRDIDFGGMPLNEFAALIGIENLFEN